MGDIGLHFGGPEKPQKPVPARRHVEQDQRLCRQVTQPHLRLPRQPMPLGQERIGLRRRQHPRRDVSRAGRYRRAAPYPPPPPPAPPASPPASHRAPQAAARDSPARAARSAPEVPAAPASTPPPMVSSPASPAPRIPRRPAKLSGMGQKAPRGGQDSARRGRWRHPLRVLPQQRAARQAAPPSWPAPRKSSAATH